LTGYVVVQALCVNDEYTSDGDSFTLDYRPIDGDVSLPQNSFKTATFVPNGKLGIMHFIAFLSAQYNVV
jgi:hypothetical protein